jgi:hypothetical protein
VNLLYAAILHWSAGGVAGFAFKVRTLLLLLLVVVVEAAVLTTIGFRFAGKWALISMSAVQVGYFVGLVARGLLEKVGFPFRSAKARRP